MEGTKRSGRVVVDGLEVYGEGGGGIGVYIWGLALQACGGKDKTMWHEGHVGVWLDPTRFA